MRNPIELNLVDGLAVFSGAYYEQFLQLTEEDGTPISLDGYTGNSWIIGQTLGVTEIIGTVTIDTINADIDGNNYSSTLGWFKLSLTDAQTSLMKPQSRWNNSRIIFNEPAPSSRPWGFAVGYIEVI